MAAKPRTDKIYRCKYCHVQVLSKHDFRAVLGKVHSKRCPRSK